MLYLLPLEPVFELILPTLWFASCPLWTGSLYYWWVGFLILLRASFLEPMVFTEDNKGLLLF